MTAARHDFTAEKGATFKRKLVYRDPAGQPIDLTGWAAKFQVRDEFNSATALVSLTEANGITLGGATGEIEIRISDEAAAAIALANVGNAFPPTMRAVYDLTLTDAAGDTFRIIEGLFLIKQGVSR